MDEDKKNPEETFTMTKADFENSIKLSLESFVKETGITKVAEVGIEAAKVLEKEHPGYAFHKSLVDARSGKEGFNTKATMNEGAAAQGGYLVPAITEGRILEIMKSAGQARSIMTVMPMSGNVLTIPAELVKPTVTWVSEASAISQSDSTLQPITLTPKKAAVISALSNELMADANPDIGNYIMKAQAESYAIAEDVAIFGNATSPFTSIFYSSNTFGGTVTQASSTTPTPTYALMVDLTLAVDQAKLTNARFVMSRTVLGLVKKIVDGQSLPIFSNAREGVPALVLGYPVTVVENAPTSGAGASKYYIAFGDFSTSIIGDASGMTFAVSNSSYVGSSSAFELDLTHIRLTKRTAYNNGILANYAALRSFSS